MIILNRKSTYFNKKKTRLDFLKGIFSKLTSNLLSFFLMSEMCLSLNPACTCPHQKLESEILPGVNNVLLFCVLQSQVWGWVLVPAV